MTDNLNVTINVYAVFDSAARMYYQPFYAQNDKLALRQFNAQLSRYPELAEDCSLYKIGEYRHSDAFISTCTPIKVGVDNE